MPICEVKGCRNEANHIYDPNNLISINIKNGLESNINVYKVCKQCSDKCPCMSIKEYKKQVKQYEQNKKDD